MFVYIVVSSKCVGEIQISEKSFPDNFIFFIEQVRVQSPSMSFSTPNTSFSLSFSTTASNPAQNGPSASISSSMVFVIVFQVLMSLHVFIAGFVFAVVSIVPQYFKCIFQRFDCNVAVSFSLIMKLCHSHF